MGATITILGRVLKKSAERNDGSNGNGRLKESVSLLPLTGSVADPTTSREPSEESVAQQAMDAIRDPYDLARQEVAKILEAVRKDEPFSVEALRSLLQGMVQALAAGDELLMRAIEDTSAQLDLPRRIVNVAIFAIRIGQCLHQQVEELNSLALSACLHDVGMSTLPPEILRKPAALSPQECALVRQHPERGFRVLQRLGPECEKAAHVALQAHERIDGSGYPKGLTADAIYEDAQIVGLAATYEAMTHSRPYRRRGLPIDVVKELISKERNRFSARVLKAFLRGLSVFPVGSLVRLNSMEVGRVLATSPELPLRPVVEVIHASNGERLEPPRREDLRTNLLLYVTGAG